jgi:hypothetical protein
VLVRCRQMDQQLVQDAMTAAQVGWRWAAFRAGNGMRTG